MGDRGWVVWEVKSERIKGRLDLHEPASTVLDTFESAALQFTWAENLPFMVGFIRLKLGQWRPAAADLHFAARHLADELFDALPGRLSPNNRRPRALARWLMVGKIKDTQMQALREAATPKDGVPDSDVLRSLLAGIPLAERDPGRIRLYSPYGNVLFVDGPGAGFIGETHGPYTLFLYSRGNLAQPSDETTGHIPFWLPPGLQATSHEQLPFWPFLFAAHNQAENLLIGAGPVDERFNQLVRRFAATSALPLAVRVWKWHAIRDTLLKDAGRASDMMARLHMSKHRTIAPPRQDLPFPSPVSAHISEKGTAWGVATDWQDLDRMYEQKLTIETEANELLTMRLQRIQDLFSVISSDYHWFWAITSGFVAVAALLVAAASLL